FAATVANGTTRALQPAAAAAARAYVLARARGAGRRLVAGRHRLGLVAGIVGSFACGSRHGETSLPRLRASAMPASPAQVGGSRSPEVGMAPHGPAANNEPSLHTITHKTRRPWQARQFLRDATRCRSSTGC